MFPQVKINYFEQPEVLSCETSQVASMVLVWVCFFYSLNEDALSDFAVKY